MTTVGMHYASSRSVCQVSSSSWSAVNLFFNISESASIVSNKMKIFQATLEYLGMLGIIDQNRSFNTRILMTITAFATLVISLGAFLFCVASNAKEYTQSIHMTSSIIALFISLFCVIWKKENLLRFIDYWEKIAEESEYQQKWVVL